MDFDFSKITDVSSARAQLKTVADEPEFGWLKPITDTTLEEFVKHELASNGPSFSRFSPYDFGKNVSIANDLINRCLTRRTQIYDLESIALQSAITYKQELRLADFEALRTRLRVQADLAVLGQPFSTPIEEDLKVRAEVLLGSLRARIGLHNIKGGSLNYGEQVTFMRRLYADNIRIIIERIAAIREGLRLCYGFNLSQLPKLPKWQDQTDNLEPIVWWIRGIVEGVEGLERAESVKTVYLSVLKLIKKQGKSPENALAELLSSGVIYFDVDERALLEGGIRGIVHGGALRVVGIAVALQANPVLRKSTDKDNDLKDNVDFENRLSWLRSASFPCLVMSPDQDQGFESAKIDLGLIPLRVNESAMGDLRPIDPGRLRNFSPYGTWGISIGPESLLGQWISGAKTYTLASLVNMTGNPSDWLDVILCLELASSDVS